MDMVMGKSESPRPGRELLKVEHSQVVRFKE